MFEYIKANQDKYFKLLFEHLSLTLYALLIAIILGMLIAFLVYKHERLANFIHNFTTSLRVVPSLVFMLILMPWLGTGRTPALISLTLIGLPFMLGHTLTGLINIEQDILEGAMASGMNQRLIFLSIRLPLASPSIVTGMRFSSLSIAAGAPIAAYIGAGGLGEFILSGMGQFRQDILLTGSISIMLICLILEIFFQAVYLYVRASIKE